ncbi:hypothetical protein B0T16DRAFT_459815 [Cercophora newfieldiana]|uniref:Uncharacterized protein n=1 Tax=Cercophora newfieldiana TaxID=92897 RepID=A0AA40CNA7_9PEZI|nr:hypothetical protein B0T16DRAFT_459815 [Cercophora newfieldiana]
MADPRDPPFGDEDEDMEDRAPSGESSVSSRASQDSSGMYKNFDKVRDPTFPGADQYNANIPIKQRLVYNDVILSDDDFDAIVQQINIRDPSQKPMAPTPQLHATEAMTGDYTYCQFVPVWTDPRWDDSHTITVRNMKGEQVAIPRRDVTKLIRPALLPQDADKNPTTYALRYGINPDAPRGRSRMSPDLSESRAATVTTDTGAEVSVNAADVRKEFEKYSNMDEFFNAMQAVGENDAGFERLQAMRQYFKELADDRDYQRYFMNDLTTQERIEHGFDPVDPGAAGIPKCDLSGDIHYLFQRSRWDYTHDRGTTQEEPRVIYNLFGESGEYSAHNDVIWAALQPALLLATRILDSSPPFINTILDPFNTRHVDPNRIPRSYRGDSKLFAIFDRFALGAPLPTQSMADLERDSRIDVAGAVCDWLGKCLRFSINAARKNTYNEETVAPPSNPVIYGKTYRQSVIPTDEHPYPWKVQIEIAAELIWPLLVPAYTMAEKSNASFMIAGTLIHELAHAIRMTSKTVTQLAETLQADIPEFQRADPTYLSKLREEMAKYMAYSDQFEGYWRDEPREEIGYAIEKELWGGSMCEPYESHQQAFPLMLMTATNLAQEEWPTARPTATEQVAAGQGNNVILNDPPLPLESYQMPITIAEVGKLFQESFWTGTVSVYGSRALRFSQDRPPLTTTLRRYIREKDLLRTFGTAGESVRVGIRKLSGAGHALVAEYIKESLSDRLFPVHVRKRWANYASLWPSQAAAAKKVEEAFDGRFEVAKKTAVLFSRLADAKLVEQDMRQLGMENTKPEVYIERVSTVFSKALRELLLAATDLHRFFLTRVQEFQAHIVDYLRLSPAARAVVHRRYAQYLHQTIEFYQHTVKTAANVLGELLQRSQTSSLLCPELQEMLQKTIARLSMLLNLLGESNEHLGIDWVDKQVRVPRRFSTVPAARYRQRSRRLAKLAFREIELMPAPVRALVDKLFHILSKTKVALDDRDEEEDDVIKKLASFDPPRPPRPAAAASGAAGGAPPQNWEGLVSNNPNPGLATQAESVGPHIFHSMGVNPPEPPAAPPSTPNRARIYFGDQTPSPASKSTPPSATKAHSSQRRNYLASGTASSRAHFSPLAEPMMYEGPRGQGPALGYDALVFAPGAAIVKTKTTPSAILPSLFGHAAYIKEEIKREAEKLVLLQMREAQEGAKTTAVVVIMGGLLVVVGRLEGLLVIIFRMEHLLVVTAGLLVEVTEGPLVEGDLPAVLVGFPVMIIMEDFLVVVTEGSLAEVTEDLPAVVVIMGRLVQDLGDIPAALVGRMAVVLVVVVVELEGSRIQVRPAPTLGDNMVASSMALVLGAVMVVEVEGRMAGVRQLMVLGGSAVEDRAVGDGVAEVCEDKIVELGGDGVVELGEGEGEVEVAETAAVVGEFEILPEQELCFFGLRLVIPYIVPWVGLLFSYQGYVQVRNC